MKTKRKYIILDIAWIKLRFINLNHLLLIKNIPDWVIQVDMCEELGKWRLVEVLRKETQKQIPIQK